MIFTILDIRVEEMKSCTTDGLENYPLAAGLFLCIALSFGIWRVAHPTKLAQVDRTANHVENRAQPSAFFKLQMQIETASPTIMITQFYETPEVVGECPQMRQISFVRNICKI